MPQIQEKIYGDLLENTSGSAVKSTPVPFLEFSVISEEGINLYVDISSSSLDWSKRLKNEVCLCQALQENKFQSFRQELEYLQKSGKHIKRSFTWNKNSENRMEADHANIEISRESFNREDSHLEVNSPDTENGSLKISEIKQCKIVHKVPGYVEQQEEDPTFCGRDSGVQGLVDSVMMSRPNHEKIEPMVGDVFCASEAKPTCSFTGICATNGPEMTRDCKSTELSYKTCMNADRKNKTREANFGVPSSVTSEISAPEMQWSEAAGLCKDVATAKMGGKELANSIEIDENGYSESLSAQKLAEDGVNRRKASCSKSGKKAEMPDGAHRIKRQCNHSDKGCGVYSGRILRSAKSHGLRRSKRIHTLLSSQ